MGAPVAVPEGQRETEAEPQLERVAGGESVPTAEGEPGPLGAPLREAEARAAAEGEGPAEAEGAPPEGVGGAERSAEGDTEREGSGEPLSSPLAEGESLRVGEPLGSLLQEGEPLGVPLSGGEGDHAALALPPASVGETEALPERVA